MTFCKVGILLALVFIPNLVHAAYGQGSYYSQTYYQSTYYSEASYQTTFTQTVIAEQNFSVTNAISKGSGTFVIDHPLDPKNKLLFHFFVESPDAKNVYDGVAKLNANGEAVIVLPRYFQVLNKDYRYQVKPITSPMPNLHVKEEIAENKFVVGGGKPNEEISWQVTGTRQDPLILAHPIIPEVEKGPDEIVERGELLWEGGRPFFPFEKLLRGLMGA